MTAEWRKVDTAPLEGSTADHTGYEYQFGAEVDGVFIPAVTKSGGYIDHLIDTAKAAKPASKRGSSKTKSDTPASGDEGGGS